jgi:hypothetical protein
VYFPKAVFLAVYADFPAAQKVVLTGSACPVCYTPQCKMGLSLEQEVMPDIYVVLRKKYTIGWKCYTNVT